MFEQTEIYQYVVPGTGDAVYVDPLAVRRELMLATEGRAVEWAKRLQEIDALLQAESAPADDEGKALIAAAVVEQVKLQFHLKEAAFAAFLITPIDAESGMGCTEATAIQMVLDFLGWCEEKKEAAVA